MPRRLLTQVERGAMLSRISGPMALEPGRLEHLLSSLSSPESFYFDDDYEAEEEKPYEVREGVAIVDLSGVLVRGAVSFIEELFGFRSYEDIAKKLDAAIADSNVRAILMRIDSPGGDAVGANDLAEKIFDSRSKKPIYGLAHGMMASAAYHTGSAVEKLYTSASSLVGHIGVWTAHVDKTAMAAAAGVKVTLIHAGARKVDSSPFRPLDEASRESIQGEVNSLYDVFTADVAKHRAHAGMDQAAVKATEALCYVGAAAVAAKLADGVKTLDGALSELAKRSAVRSTSTGGRAATSTTSPARPAKEGPMDLEQALAALKAGKEELLAKGEKISALESANSKLITENAELRAQATGLVEKAKNDVIEKHVKAGRVTPAMRGDVELLAKSISPAELDERLSKWSVVTRPVGAGSGAVVEEAVEASPIDKLNAKAKELQAANPALKFPDAFEQACRVLPDLYNAHRATKRIVKKGA